MHNDQEEFWKGSFGDSYTERISPEKLISANLYLFGRIFKSLGKCNSIVELGCNIGLNLVAINQLMPECRLAGVEINVKALIKLKKMLPTVEDIDCSLLKFDPKEKFDLSFTKGVLIHILPEDLPAAYASLYNASNKYILIAEYYNPEPTEIVYRGHKNRLFKRDFCKEISEIYDDVELIDYGFIYKRDPKFPQDDLNWFLMKKTDRRV